jgi:thioredoxin reductase
MTAALALPTDVRERFALDAVIVGAGPAGLSAALILARCRRRVLVVDDGRPRNRMSRAVHGFLTRDGTPPAELLQLAREQIARYRTVRIEQGHVRNAACAPDGFLVQLADDRRFTTPTLLLATGVVDRLPDRPGFEEFYGRGVYSCPYCDGWEVRDRPLAAYGRGSRVARLAVTLTTWTNDVVVCTDGPSELSAEDLRQLDAHYVTVCTKSVETLEGDKDGLQAIRFTDGSRLPRAALFVGLGMVQRSDLAANLGCPVSEDHGPETDALARTVVRGLFVAGDASRDVALAVVAAAEGAEAAFAMNKLLVELAATNRNTGGLSRP